MRSWHTAGALALAAVLAGCTSGTAVPADVATSAAPTPATSSTAPPVTHPMKGITSYVAVGDSFTSGPGIDTQSQDAGLCFRSDRNYASLLRDDLEITDFTDASCAGATTSDLLAAGSGPRGLPAQLDSVTRDSTLVTVGIGGNDAGLFGTLFTACSESSNASGDGCRSFIDSRLPTILDSTRSAVIETLQDAAGRAPDATVVLVGYLRLAPDTSGCATLPIKGADRASVVGAEQALDTMLAGAAKTAGVEFVSMRKASDGHDACAGTQAWTNGTSPPDGDGIVLHPNAAGMQAVATAIRERLARG